MVLVHKHILAKPTTYTKELLLTAIRLMCVELLNTQDTPKTFRKSWTDATRIYDSPLCLFGSIHASSWRSLRLCEKLSRAVNITWNDISRQVAKGAKGGVEWEGTQRYCRWYDNGIAGKTIDDVMSQGTCTFFTYAPILAADQWSLNRPPTKVAETLAPRTAVAVAISVQ